MATSGSAAPIAASASGSSAVPTLIASSPGSATFVMPNAPAVSTPTTIAIALAQSPLPKISLWENGTVLVALFALGGVVLTLVGAHIRMRSELAEAADRAKTERDQTRELADLDREQARDQANEDREQARAQSKADWQHQAGEAHRERIATARRAVYLEAVDALTQAQMFLGSLANADITNVDYRGGMGDLLAAVGKVAVVGEMETVRNARELSSSLNVRFFSGLRQLVPMAGYRAALAVHKSEQELAQVEIKRIIAAMVHHNEALKNEPKAATSSC